MARCPLEACGWRAGALLKPIGAKQCSARRAGALSWMQEWPVHNACGLGWCEEGVVAPCKPAQCVLGLCQLTAHALLQSHSTRRTALWTICSSLLGCTEFHTGSRCPSRLSWVSKAELDISSLLPWLLSSQCAW